MRDEQKLSSLEGFVVPQGGRRASGRRGGSGSDAEHRARESPKNGAQARRFFGLAGAADRGDLPSGQRGPPARESPAGALGGRRGGLQTSLGKNVLFKGGLQPPP